MEAELNWLMRRRKIIAQAVAEMEHQETNSIIPDLLDPDVPGSLRWAREELARIDSRMAEISQLTSG